MAREIDLSGSLSEKDLAYLAQRPWLVQDAELIGAKGVREKVKDYAEGNLVPDPVEDTPEPPRDEEPPPNATVNTNLFPTGKVEDGTGIEGDIAENGGLLEDPEAPETVEDDGDDYEEATVAQLKDELKARDLPVSGNHAELVARLREHDAELDAAESAE